MLFELCVGVSVSDAKLVVILSQIDRWLLVYIGVVLDLTVFFKPLVRLKVSPDNLLRKFRLVHAAGQDALSGRVLHPLSNPCALVLIVQRLFAYELVDGMLIYFYVVVYVLLQASLCISNSFLLRCSSFDPGQVGGPCNIELFEHLLGNI